jgi:hypothetical protein
MMHHVQTDQVLTKESQVILSIQEFRDQAGPQSWLLMGN